MIYIATSTTYPEEVRGLVEWMCSIVRILWNYAVKREETEMDDALMSKRNKKKITILKIIISILIILVGALAFFEKIPTHIMLLLEASILVIFFTFVKKGEGNSNEN